jgi:hypothetical protein
MAQIPSADLPVVNKDTGRINLEWYAALQRLVSEIAALGSGGVTSFEGRTGVVVGVADDYLASEVENDSGVAGAQVSDALDTLSAGKQPLDADLTALAALAGTGLVARTGAATYAERTLTAPAAGITVANGDGVAGNPTLALANDLAALEGMAGTGIVARTAAETYAQRTITGTANEITVADGSGVAGDPTLSLPATIDLGGKTSLEIPNSAAPTVDADGEIAVDTTVTDFSHGVLKYFGGEEMGVVAMPIAQFTAPTDGYAVTYNATADEFQLASVGGASGDFALLTSGTVSAAATLDIVLTSYTSYRGLVFMLSGFLPATDNVDLYMRFSTNGGSSYDAGAGNYLYASTGFDSAGAARNQGSTGATQILLTSGVSSRRVDSTSSRGVNTIVELLNQTSTAFRARCTFRSATGGDDADTQGMCVSHGEGMRDTAQDTDAVRFLFSSGNIAAGNYAVYGLA